MKLIVGLGNPGREYARTRHNAGFMVVEALAARHGIQGTSSRFHGDAADGRIGGVRCVLLRPLTFMNRSGRSVRAAVDFYKLDLGDVLLVVDDTALECGRMRLRARGSAGGHNGLIDVERALGTPDYARLRIGIDAPAVATRHDHVLGRFTPAELSTLQETIVAACDAIECWIAEGIEIAMSRFNH